MIWNQDSRWNHPTGGFWGGVYGVDWYTCVKGQINLWRSSARLTSCFHNIFSHHSHIPLILSWAARSLNYNFLVVEKRLLWRIYSRIYSQRIYSLENIFNYSYNSMISPLSLLLLLVLPKPRELLWITYWRISFKERISRKEKRKQEEETRML